MKEFGGRILFLDRGDINTDEIIPARYLTESQIEALKPYCLEDLKLEGFDPKRDVPGKGAILTRGNFGCGSSREHAPWALETNGIHLVMAESFARIFRQNMFNRGLIAVELPAALITDLFTRYASKSADVAVDLEAGRLTFSALGAEPLELPFHLGAFDAALVRAGGWVEFAAERY